MRVLLLLLQRFLLLLLPLLLTTTAPLGSALSLPNQSGSSGTGAGWIDRPAAPIFHSAATKSSSLGVLDANHPFQKRLSLLGSTGSIGTQTLEIVDACPEHFVVEALSAGTNVDRMLQQVLKYKPRIASLSTAAAADELKRRLQAAGCADMPDIVFGPDGMVAAATVPGADMVVTGIVGAAGLEPTIQAIKMGKDIALANKETLISGGPVILPLVQQYGVNMVSIGGFF
jgi:1-deoxy-D-xylulose-5-phosphate reductoisomerase